MAEGSQVHSAREPRDVLKTAGSQVGTILALGSTGKTTNLLLVRDDVGRPKPTCFNLPDHQFSYGRPGNQDSEGAREVSMRWVGHIRSKRMQAEEPDFMSVNRKAAADRVTNAKDLRQYFRQVPDPPRLSGRKGNPGKPLIPSDVIPGFAYGRKVRPSTPIQETADPTQSLTREREVQQALQHLEEACIQQRRIQDHGQTECEAELTDTATPSTLLTRRRGQAVESFGHRQDGEWILEPEETLYLAERGSLSVFQASGDPESPNSGSVKRRRLGVPELYRQLLPKVGVDSYVVYAHLRRSGYKVSRSENGSPEKEWELAASAGCNRVHIVRPEEPVLQCLLHLGETWEGQVDMIEHALDEAPAGIAVADAARGSPAFLEICRPSCRGEDRLDREEPKGEPSECGGSVEGEEFQAVLQPPLEKALPPAQRYSAMLHRVAQLGAAVQVAKAKAKPSSAKITKCDAEDAWLL